jgi:hypothetical protein
VNEILDFVHRLRVKRTTLPRLNLAENWVERVEYRVSLPLASWKDIVLYFVFSLAHLKTEAASRSQMMYRSLKFSEDSAMLESYCFLRTCIREVNNLLI